MFVLSASPGRETTTSQAAVNSKQAGNARTGGRKLRSDSEQDLLQSKQQLLAHLSEFVLLLMVDALHVTFACGWVDNESPHDWVI